ncbi:MAG: DNA-processing protein DprA [Candidatus Binatia bacterium]|nr:DNA-processing protein DprA [Candidatus Binatia bacterium]
MAQDRARGVAVSIEDEQYPGPLRHIFDPPDVLFVEGCGAWGAGLGGLAVAIVGARDATAQGLATARSLGRDLAAAGVAVVSGLALGIDGAAHAGALEAGGVTVAVVGGGTDVVYPRRNRRIREEILERGLIVSEWPPGMEPRAYHFPRRNRLISGLSLGVVVVEATERSGSLITARQAAEQGREVFAVPGPAGAPRSKGPHSLLKDGARLVEDVHDILEELRLDAFESCAEPEEEAAGAAALLAAIGEGALTVDEMVVRAHRSVEEIWADLLDLEVRGRIVRGPGGRFAQASGPRA